jgi:REP element-mobilizing transposase RayT
MARSLRIEYAGAYYHVMARGNRREAIFLDDDDRRFFLQVLAEACGQTGWRVHAWVLMGNHYHLFLETPEANLVAGMKWLQITVARRFNIRHGKWGHLFGDRYKAILVEGEQADYFEKLLDYIHLNPARAHLIDAEKGESILDYPWSSLAGGYALPPGKRAKWFSAAAGLGVKGLKDSASGRREMVERLDRRILEEGDGSGLVPLPDEVDARMSHLRRGWYWGRQEFGQQMLKLAGKLVGKNRSRSYRRSAQTSAHGEQQAEQWIGEGLKIAGLDDSELAALVGSDVRKVALAKLAWKKTTVSQGWIAKRLAMGSPANVSQALSRMSWEDLEKKLPPDLRKFLRQARSR